MAEVSPGFCLAAAALVLIVPLPWVLSAFLAGAFHELCHIGTIRLLGGRISGLRFRAGGAELRMAGLSFFQELLAAGAGPAGSLALVLLRYRCPKLAVCGLIQGLYNLLPVYPMDGGRMALCGLSLILGPERGARAAAGLGWAVLAAVAGLGLGLTFLNGFHPIPLMISLEILWKAKKFLQTAAPGITIG